MKKYVMEKTVEELEAEKKKLQEQQKELNKKIKKAKAEEEKKRREEEQKRHVEELEKFYKWAKETTLTHTDNATGENKKMTVLELYQENKNKKRKPIIPTQQN